MAITVVNKIADKNQLFGKPLAVPVAAYDAAKEAAAKEAADAEAVKLADSVAKLKSHVTSEHKAALDKKAEKVAELAQGAAIDKAEIKAVKEAMLAVNYGASEKAVAEFMGALKGAASVKALHSTGLVCSLTEAEYVGVPVKGTSETSVYTCIAIGDTLKAAARQQGNKISLRVEPAGEGMDTTALAKAGLSNAGGTHASVHFENEGGELFDLYGAVMAYLFTIDENWRQVLPNLRWIKGVGK